VEVERVDAAAPQVAAQQGEEAAQRRQQEEAQRMEVEAQRGDMVVPIPARPKAVLFGTDSEEEEPFEEEEPSSGGAGEVEVVGAKEQSPPPPRSPGTIIPTLNKEQCKHLISTFESGRHRSGRTVWDPINFSEGSLTGRAQATAFKNPARFGRPDVEQLLQEIVDTVGVLGKAPKTLDRAVLRTKSVATHQPLHCDTDEKGDLWGSLTALSQGGRLLIMVNEGGSPDRRPHRPGQHLTVSLGRHGACWCGGHAGAGA
jgi:hypothetical protein